MPAQVWIRRLRLVDSDRLESEANQHLQAVEARGGRLLNSFFVTAPGLYNTTVLILTLITDEPAEPQKRFASGHRVLTQCLNVA